MPAAVAVKSNDNDNSDLTGSTYFQLYVIVNISVQNGNDWALSVMVYGIERKYGSDSSNKYEIVSDRLMRSLPLSG